MSDIEDSFKRLERTILDGIEEWKKTILDAFAAMNDEAERRHAEAMALVRGLHAEAPTVRTWPDLSDELPDFSPALRIGDPIEIWTKRPKDGGYDDWYLARVVTIDAGGAWAKVEVSDDYGTFMKKIWLAHDRDPPWRKSP